MRICHSQVLLLNQEEGLQNTTHTPAHCQNILMRVMLGCFTKHGMLLIECLIGFRLNKI